MKITNFFFLLCLLLASSKIQAQAGTLDPTFADNGLLEFRNMGSYTRFYKVEVQPDQKILTYGTTYTGTYQANVFRFNPDGTADTTFGQNGAFGTSTVSPIYTGNDGVLLPDGSMILLCDDVISNTKLPLIKLLPNGTKDPSFGTNGVSIYTSQFADIFPLSIIAQEDGKLLIFGECTIVPNNTYYGFALRVLANGIADSTFGTNGVITFTPPTADWELSISSAVEQPDGKIVFGGFTGNNETNAVWYLARVNPDGSFDPTFDGDGVLMPNIGNIFWEGIGKVILLPDGKIIAAGYGQKLPGWHFTTLRLNSDGSLDTSYGFGGKAQVAFSCCYSSIFDFIQQPDGKLLACGFSSADNIHRRFSLARFKANGLIDTEFGTLGKKIIEIDHDSTAAEANSMALQADGKLLVTGLTIHPVYEWVNTALMARLNLGNAASSTINPTMANLELSASPNPISNSTIQVNYTLQSATSLTLTLLDNAGKQIHQPLNTVERNAGPQQESLYLPENLPAGTYFLHLETEVGNQLIQILKL